ncbi:MAG: hypothetical protein ABFS37_03600 [Acidobacteriota bacterium]
MSTKKLLISVLFVMVAGIATAEVIDVPGEQPTIQAGINAAVNGDTVLVQPGTYPESISFLGKSITVASLYDQTQDAGYIDSTIISSAGTVVWFVNGETADSILSGFTIQDGTDRGIDCYYASPSIRNVIITNNTSDGDGAGINLYFSNPTIDNAVISFNSISAISSGTGGGIHGYFSDAVITNTTISDNTVLVSPYSPTSSADAKGGGVDFYGSAVTMTNVTVSNNSALTTEGDDTTAMGGGISMHHGSGLLIQDSVVSNNTSDTYGGGIYCRHTCALEAVNVIIDNNVLNPDWSDGGGIYAGGGDSIITDVQLTNNLADVGGAIYYVYDHHQLTNVLIAQNTAYFGAGIITNAVASLSLENVTVSDNAAIGSNAGGGIHDFYESTVDISNSIFWNNTPFEIYSTTGWVTADYSDIRGGLAGTGNIDADPISVDGYHLSQIAAGQAEDSPCVDAGDPVSTMIDGTTRTDNVQDAGVVDMGYHYPIVIPEGLIFSDGFESGDTTAWSATAP